MRGNICEVFKEIFQSLRHGVLFFSATLEVFVRLGLLLHLGVLAQGSVPGTKIIAAIVVSDQARCSAKEEGL